MDRTAPIYPAQELWSLLNNVFEDGFGLCFDWSVKRLICLFLKPFQRPLLTFAMDGWQMNVKDAWQEVVHALYRSCALVGLRTQCY